VSVGKRLFMSAAERRRPIQPGDHFRAIRTCDAVLAALERYLPRDEAIQHLELAIVGERADAIRALTVESALRRLNALSPGPSAQRRRTGT
jgi:hypothetical protein